LLERGQTRPAAVLVLLYGLACLPLYRWAVRFESGWQMFLAFPRLYAMVALMAFLLWKLQDSPG
jgi:hypothetical protein